MRPMTFDFTDWAKANLQPEPIEARPTPMRDQFRGQAALEAAELYVAAKRIYALASATSTETREGEDLHNGLFRAFEMAIDEAKRIHGEHAGAICLKARAPYFSTTSECYVCGRALASGEAGK